MYNFLSIICWTINIEIYRLISKKTMGNENNPTAAIPQGQKIAVTNVANKNAAKASGGFCWKMKKNYINFFLSNDSL